VHEPSSARHRRCAHTAADRTDRAPTALAAAAAALAAAAFVVVRLPRLLAVAVKRWDGLPHGIEALSRCVSPSRCVGIGVRSHGSASSER